MCYDVTTNPKGQTMIHFEIDGVEYTAEIVTLAEFEDEYYDDAILEGASFLSPDGQTYVVLAPKRAIDMSMYGND